MPESTDIAAHIASCAGAPLLPTDPTMRADAERLYAASQASARTRRLYIGSTSASPTAGLLRGYGRAGTQNDCLGEAVILSTGTPIPAP